MALDRRAVRRLGLPLSAPLVRRGRAAVGGTVLTGRLALAHGLACNTAGGSHHAFADHGAGFCLFNDVAVAIRVLRQEGLIERALVVDLDVHQGDGTAAIFQGEAETFTFSLHCEANYPPAKETSDLDIGVPARHRRWGLSLGAHDPPADPHRPPSAGHRVLQCRSRSP